MCAQDLDLRVEDQRTDRTRKELKSRVDAFRSSLKKYTSTMHAMVALLTRAVFTDFKRTPEMQSSHRNVP